MAGLAHSLAGQGIQVTYVAETEMSAERKDLGWTAPELEGMRVLYMHDAGETRRLVEKAKPHSIHVCQGIRGNGLVSEAQRALTKRGLEQWVVMETIDDSGPRGWVKRVWYGLLFRRYRSRLHGVLATGHTTVDWVLCRGMPAERVWTFAYFLEDLSKAAGNEVSVGPFCFLFVGRLDENKRLLLLMEALAKIDRTAPPFVLSVVGTGPLENELRTLAKRVLPGRVQWVGGLARERIHEVMAKADCLVLPSLHDGWGAVVSEALMAGTPVICSDSCGAAGVVRASEAGGVFSRDSQEELRALLQRILHEGRQPCHVRVALAHWAKALGAEAGAKYLSKIFDFTEMGGDRPLPPWVSK